MHPRRLLVAVLLLTLALPLGTVGAHAAGDRQPRTWAERSLDRASAMLQEQRAGTGADGDLTMTMRRLARSLNRLEDHDREHAERLLARPDDRGGDLLGVKYRAASEYLCSEDICVHWVRTTSDAPPEGRLTVPPQVDRTLFVFQEVWDALVDEAGYRPPQSDLDSPNPGPDGRLDVYLADIGGIGPGYYGFCNSDDPDSPTAHARVSAYCVVDNDFSKAQFGGDPDTSLRVTAAHEFFHAVQFSYDLWEDLWFMEGTAAWAEELVYDDADDNHRYLGGSQLSQPWVSLDTSDGGAAYGSWIFWQFLTERFGEPGLPDATIVRDVWELAEGKRASLSALDLALQRRGTSLSEVYVEFGLANLAPAAFYDEGAAFDLGVPFNRRMRLSEEKPVKKNSTVLDHLATDYFRFKAAPDLGQDLVINVRVDMPDRATGSAATLVVERRGGILVVKPFKLSREGVGKVRANFSRNLVTAVYLVVANAGPTDEGRTTFRAKAVTR